MKLSTLSLLFAAVGGLSGCSGGGGDSTPPPPPPPPPSVGSITLAGVVAKGAALANASVAATCATGTGTATTGANGSYSLSITGGALPCVLKATSSDNLTRLHSVAPAGSSTSVTANVTPLTELVVAQLTGKEPAAYVASVVIGTLGSVATASAVAAAQTSLASTLAAGGVSSSTAGDFISGALVAANGTSTGNAYDLVLDALNARLVAAGTTLAALTRNIADGAAPPPAPGTPPTTSDVASLPADLLLKPKAANCASLASGSYRLIRFAASPGSTVTAVETFNFDAPTLTFSNGNPADTFTMTPNGNCRFSIGTDADIVVSPAGVMVARAFIGSNDDTVAVPARGTTRMIVMLPVQTIAVADLAGTWNLIGWERNGTYGESGTIVTVASTGAVTQAKCDELATPETACPSSTTGLPVFSANSAGGFNLTSTDPQDLYTDRVYAYRAGNGDLMAVALSSDGDLAFLTKVRTLTLPAVGPVTTNWNVDLRVTGLASDPLYYRTHTVASVNTTAGSLVRNTSNDAGTVTVPQTLEYNKARNGYLHRPAATTAASDGSAATVREIWALPLRGFGMTVVYVPATSGTGTSSNALFELSIAKQP